MKYFVGEEEITEAEYSTIKASGKRFKVKNGDHIQLSDDEEAVLDADFLTETARQAKYAADYSRLRKVEYDKLNQFEMQFDDQRDSTTTWVDAINTIKDKYPKE